MLRFDGSFQGGQAAGVGITLEYAGCLPFAKFAVPLTVLGAQHAEMCGPTLGALLLSVLTPACVSVEGDCKYVVGLLDRKHTAHESYFLNATNLCLDMLKLWQVQCRWIPRDQNSACD